MSNRAAIILLQDDQIAMIERHRAGLHYFTFPGGHVEPGEAPEQAAVREAKEELGVDVSIQRLVAEIQWHAKPQYYYFVVASGGQFGTGTGEEMNTPLPERGSYQPVWIPVKGLLDLPVFPRSMAEIVVKACSAGWSDTPALLNDED
jgi:8-oxo-dGTP diphosphatase